MTAAKTMRSVADLSLFLRYLSGAIMKKIIAIAGVSARWLRSSMKLAQIPEMVLHSGFLPVLRFQVNYFRTGQSSPCDANSNHPPSSSLLIASQSACLLAE